MVSLSAKIFAVLFVSGFFSQAWSAQFAPVSQNVRVGTFSGSVADVAAAGDSRTLKFYTNSRGNLTIDYDFRSISASSTLTLKTRFLQFRATDVFTLSYLNTSGSWTNFARITGGAAKVWKDLSLSVPAAALRSGSATLRIKSNRGADDGEIDLFALDNGSTVQQPNPVESEPTPEPTPTPTPEPTPTPAPTPTPVPTTAITPGTTWYWQLQGTINTAQNVKVYDIDLYDTSTTMIQSLKASGKFVLCYFSAGSYENWRSDASQFPASALGNNLDGWPGERWLDIRNQEVRNIMARRMDLAKSKGCDGLEPDNVDGYQNNPGFPLTAQDQINYLSYLADQAHARGLQIALKNSTDLVKSLVDKFDFAVVEECFKYNECQMYSPFVQKGKAVLNAEYSSYSGATCSTAKSLGFSTVFYNLALDGKVFQPCQ